MKEFDFWKAAEEAKKVTDQWPDWKRNVRLTEYSTGLGPRKNESTKKTSLSEKKEQG